MKQRKKGGVSQTTLDDFLAEQGLLERCEAQAIKEILAEPLNVQRRRRQARAIAASDLTGDDLMRFLADESE
jgi:hypothetical protein